MTTPRKDPSHWEHVSKRLAMKNRLIPRDSGTALKRSDKFVRDLIVRAFWIVLEYGDLAFKLGEDLLYGWEESGFALGYWVPAALGPQVPCYSLFIDIAEEQAPNVALPPPHGIRPARTPGPLKGGIVLEARWNNEASDFEVLEYVAGNWAIWFGLLDPRTGRLPEGLKPRRKRLQKEITCCTSLGATGT